MVVLIWDGKNDRDGKCVAPLRVAPPFQTVETVNESAQERDRSLFAYAAQLSCSCAAVLTGKKAAS